MLLTIAIAVYNGEKYLSQMVDSILYQSMRDYELLLLDDGSQDRSGAICDAYAKQDARVQVVHKENTGLCASRNLAIRLAKGSHICFLDQDDRLLPGMLERFADAIRHCTADFYLGGYQIRIENAAGSVIGKRLICAQDTWLDSADKVRHFYLEHLGDGVVAPVWNIFYSVDYLRSHGLWFDEGLRMSLDDLAFHAQSFFAAKRVQVLSNIGNVYYVRTEPSSSRKYNDQFLNQCAQVLLRLQDQFTVAGMNSVAEMEQFYRLVARLYVVSGLQNLVYARKTLGREQVLLKMQMLFQAPMTVNTVCSLSGKVGLSRYERLVLRCIRKNHIRLLFTIIAWKDWIYRSHFLTAAKRLAN